MSTIRTRDSGSPVSGHGARSQPHRDRRALLNAGDVLATEAEYAALQLVNLREIVRTDPRYRGTPMATETRLIRAIAGWLDATGPREAKS